MPWSNNGGGGWKGGGGPWGSGPQQRGPQPPDLEELLKRSQDRLRNVLPTGGRGNISIAILIIAALVVLWLFKCVYTVQPDELGQELVFGKPKAEVSMPGLHFLFWPIETVILVPTSVQRDTLTADSSHRGTSGGNLMLSGDQNIISIDFSVLWRITDPKKYLFNVADQKDLLRRVAESAMRELVGRSTAEDVRTGRRAEVEDGVRKLLQNTLNDYSSGITIVGVQLEKADPPDEVADAFEEVQRAQQDLDRFQREADAYANRRLGEARGKAAQVTEEALGYKQQVVAAAEGESQRFLSVLKEYEQAKNVTRQRLYYETLERVLANANKVILDKGANGPGVLPYLPLDQLMRKGAATPRKPSTTTITTPSTQGTQSKGGGQ